MGGQTLCSMPNDDALAFSRPIHGMSLRIGEDR
jgi:hypothetical protein